MSALEGAVGALLDDGGDGLPALGGELHQLVGHLVDELVQTGEAHIGLVLDSSTADDPHSADGRTPCGSVEKCRLAHSRFACQQEGCTVSPGSGQERVDSSKLALATEETVRVVVQLSHRSRSTAPP
jgi:hypothetical protein